MLRMKISKMANREKWLRKKIDSPNLSTVNTLCFCVKKEESLSISQKRKKKFIEHSIKSRIQSI
jgi:hypothetical protein